MAIVVNMLVIKDLLTKMAEEGCGLAQNGKIVINLLHQGLLLKMLLD